MKKLSKILIVIGLLLILVPIVGKIYVSYEDSKLIRDWEKNQTSNEVVLEPDNMTPEQTYNALRKVFDAESSSAVNTEPKAYKNGKVLGIIKIAKINIKMPIVEGTTQENLNVGIGHIPGTAGLGMNGNAALAGHRNYTFGRFFSRLDELERGDKVTLITKTKTYNYIVYEKLVVLPNDVSVLKYKENDNIITLITCTPMRASTHRLIIHARFVSN